MTTGQDGDGPAECSHPSGVETASSRRDRDERPRRVMTDGGQAEMVDEAEEHEPEEQDDGESEAEEHEPEEQDADESEAEEHEPEEQDADESEAEEHEPEEQDDGESEAEEQEPEEQDADESEAEEDTADDAAEEHEPEDGDAKGAESDAEESPKSAEEQEREDAEEPEVTAEGDTEEGRAEGHADNAEDVYEGDDASGVLHLDLDGLFLDLLGLEVNLNEVTLDVSARPGENNLLGNLLSAVSGLLDGPGAMLDKITSLLRKPGEFLRQLPQKATSFLRSLLGIGGEDGEGEDESESGGRVASLVGWLTDLLGKPVAWLRGLIGGEAAEAPDDADEAPDDEETADEKAEESPGPLARLGSWLRETLVGLVPGLPVEDLVATVVSQVLEQLIDQLEPESDQPGGDQPDAAQEAA